MEASPKERRRAAAARRLAHRPVERLLRIDELRIRTHAHPAIRLVRRIELDDSCRRVVAERVRKLLRIEAVRRLHTDMRALELLGRGDHNAEEARWAHPYAKLIELGDEAR